MDIVKAILKIFLVSDRMFPETLLPNYQIAVSAKFPWFLCGHFLYFFNPWWKIFVIFCKGQNEMNVIRQNAIGNQIKMMIFLDGRKCRKETLDVSLICEKFYSVRCNQGEEVGAAGNVISDEFWHSYSVTQDWNVHSGFPKSPKGIWKWMWRQVEMRNLTYTITLRNQTY